MRRKTGYGSVTDRKPVNGRYIGKSDRFVCRRRIVQVLGPKGAVVLAYQRWSIWDKVEKTWVRGGPKSDMRAIAKELSVSYRKLKTG